MNLVTTNSLSNNQFGFKNIKFCLPTKETFHSELIDKQIFEKEWESDFENPHTLIMEAEKL